MKKWVYTGTLFASIYVISAIDALLPHGAWWFAGTMSLAVGALILSIPAAIWEWVTYYSDKAYRAR